MSIFGAMQAGISGLSAQSSAMGAVSDNIVNINTVGYKGTSVAFQTLVTKQTSSSMYSSGGVQSSPKQGINVQGLLSSVSSNTALAVSGSGYFVVNQAANPSNSDLWAYTRAGDFDIDNNGYLKNTGGFYAQGWSLLPWDGNASASVVNIGGINYMKAYYDTNGKTVYINDNIIDSSNLKPVNLSTIGGTATPTQQISLGANLPSSDPIFDASNDKAGGQQKISALIYDSLGNASNLSLTYTKTSSNGWQISSSVPSGASSIVLKGTADTSDLAADVYAAAGQLEFKSIPANGSSIGITTQGQTYTFVFANNDADVAAIQAAGNIAVDTRQCVSLSDFSDKFAEAIQQTVPSGGRFSSDNGRIVINQSLSGEEITLDASKTLACVQNASNPDPASGLPTGKFTIPAIDDAIKNCARIDFNSTTAADYIGKTISIAGKTYTFRNGNEPTDENNVNIADAISGADVNPYKIVEALKNTLTATAEEPERFIASGMSLEIEPSITGSDITLNTTDLAGAINGEIRQGNSFISLQNADDLTLTNTFTTSGDQQQQGSMAAGIRFNSDGTPKQFFVDSMEIEWANGAENMNNDPDNGSSIQLSMGNVGTNDGLTNLSGSFTTNYIRQDGAKFGSYSGVSVDENGVVTAQFDNGETRPIAILPLATFANPNGMSSLTGNSWIETDSSGQALLKQAGTNGAGVISSNSTESSTVDLASEMSNMIVVQRAYSAATKIITAADEMLDELTRMS